MVLLLLIFIIIHVGFSIGIILFQNGGVTMSVYTSIETMRLLDSVVIFGAGAPVRRCIPPEKRNYRVAFADTLQTSLESTAYFAAFGNILGTWASSARNYFLIAANYMPVIVVSWKSWALANGVRAESFWKISICHKDPTPGTLLTSGTAWRLP